MSIEFLGNKGNLLNFIVPIIEKNTAASGEKRSITDLFCGTGAISAAFKSKGYRVTANDQMAFCCHFAKAKLFNSASKPLFEEFAPINKLKNKLDNYRKLLDELNNTHKVSGFIHQQYSPASKFHSSYERMYFTEENAMKIDAIRMKLEKWKPMMKEEEWSLLLTDLLIAVSKVSNTAGTFGCYLKSWKKKALVPLKLVPSEITAGSPKVEVFCSDANLLAPKQKNPIVYADPPYTKRQYAAYYHILETITLYDNPEITGSTGLRKWLDKQSDFCYKRKAPQALKRLLEQLRCNHFFLSYNEDGQIPHDQILKILRSFGTVKAYEMTYTRYKSSRLKHKGSHLIERLYHLKMV